MTKKQFFPPVNQNVNFPQLEEKLLKYWKENKIFEKSVEMRPADKMWTFLDGPPFVTGMPHYGSLLPRIAKDVFPRFWTMKGFRVRRVWGWDGHGLPVENKVEQKLGVKRKKDIEEKIGIKKFISECLNYVEKTASDWEWYVDHIGEWVDFKNAYKTWNLPYMESVMWVFKQIYDKGYIYKGLRVSLFCPHCSTPISNFEVAMDADNYKVVTEPTAVFMYALRDDPDTYLLAWSTTPWNKLATPALAVNPKLTYVKVLQGKKKYILAKSTLSMLTPEPYKILDEFTGSKLTGLTFVPHYEYYGAGPGKKAFIVIPGDFVTSEEGTGIVTIAAYGEEDLGVMQKENIQLVMHVDEEGMLKKEVPKWGGMYYLDVDPLVIADLKERGLIYRVDEYTHSVPTCWRCHTRLFYGPQNAWYVNIQKLKKQMAATNEEVNWFPPHFKEGRFLKSLLAAPDWCISRSRYWGSPVPVWECGNCSGRLVPGSIAELEKLSGRKITNLHKPDIDEVTFKCSKCGSLMKRVPEVLDSWTEAGSASFGERHYPFDATQKLESFFPPDFIVEYTGQIRAWFYVLHVITNAIYKSKAFKNAMVTGVILGTDGRKMSKNFGNYPDPKKLLEIYGGDALRLYLLGSPVMHAEDIRISEQEYRDQIKGFMLLLWNVYNFFVTYANSDNWMPPKVFREPPGRDQKNILDHWILGKYFQLQAGITKDLEKYDTVSVVKQAESFVDNLSKWYIRRSRDRVGPAAGDQNDKKYFYETLYFVLVSLCRLMAPVIPFLTEEIFRGLTGEESVHLTQWPAYKTDVVYGKLSVKMEMIREIAEKVHAIRKKFNIKLRQPLPEIWFLFKVEENEKEQFGKLAEILLSEINVKKYEFHDPQEVDKDKKKADYSVSKWFYLDTTITPELKAEGEARELIRDIQKLRKVKECTIDQRIGVVLPEEYRNLPEKLIEYIKKETLSAKLSWGKSLNISTG